MALRSARQARSYQHQFFSDSFWRQNETRDWGRSFHINRPGKHSSQEDAEHFPLQGETSERLRLAPTNQWDGQQATTGPLLASP